MQDQTVNGRKPLEPAPNRRRSLIGDEPKTLRFTRVRLVKCRNFVDVDVALTGRVLLIDPNASGKGGTSSRLPKTISSGVRGR